MQEIDRAFKTVLALKPDCFLDLLFGRERKIMLKGIADPQINLPELRADKALVVEESGKVYCIIFEAMLHPAPAELPTFALKALGTQYLLKRPSLVVIVYLERGRYASFPESFENRVGGISNQFTFTKLLMWEYESRILSGELRELAPFLPLFQEQPDPILIEAQKNLIGEVSEAKLRDDLIATAMIVDIRAFGTQVVIDKFHRELNMLKETSIVQEWLDESSKEGERRGERRGERKGERKGVRKGKLLILQNMLIRKFGSPPPELLGELQRLSNEQLDRLGLALLEINSPDDLREWLNNGAS